MPISGSDKALMYARSGLARSGATRADYYNPVGKIEIGGTDRTSNVLKASLSITQAMDNQPDSCTMIVQGFTPAEGQTIKVGLGALNNLLFSGRILSVEKFYAGRSDNIYFQINAVDHLWEFNQKQVTRAYSPVSGYATTYDAMVRDLVATYAPGFDYTSYIQTGLPSLERNWHWIGARLSDVLNDIAKHVYEQSPAFSNATSDRSTSASSLSVAHTIAIGANYLRVAVALNTVSQTVSTVTYGGVALTKLTHMDNNDHATHKARVEYWYLLSPAVGTANVVVTLTGTAGIAVGAVSYSNVNQSTPHGTAATAKGASNTPSVTVTSAAGELVVDAVSSKHDPLTALLTAHLVGSGQTARMTQHNGLGSNSGLASDEAGAASVIMSWFAQDGTTKYWASIGVSLKPLSVQASWYVDEDKRVHFYPSSESVQQPGDITGTDGMTWDFVYEKDISQIRTRVKCYYAKAETVTYLEWGDTSRDFTGSALADWPSSGTFVHLGITLSYTSKTLVSGDTYTIGGISGWPATFLGTPFPARVEPVYQVVTVNDTAAQSALAALTGGDGIVEYTIVADSVVSSSEATTLAQGELTGYKDPEAAARYFTRDKFTSPGKVVTVNLSAPWSIAGDLKIQKVTITDIELSALAFGSSITEMGVFPKRAVEAFPIRKDFIDMMNQTIEAP